MKYLVTFEQNTTDLSRPAITSVYGVPNSTPCGRIFLSNIDGITPKLLFYGKNNVNRHGIVDHEAFDRDFVSKEYPTLKDFIENEGRYLMFDHQSFYRKPIKL